MKISLQSSEQISIEHSTACDSRTKLNYMINRIRKYKKKTILTTIISLIRLIDLSDCVERRLCCKQIMCMVNVMGHVAKRALVNAKPSACEIKVHKSSKEPK